MLQILSEDDYCPACDEILGVGIWDEIAEVLVRKCENCGAEVHFVPGLFIKQENTK